MSKEEIKQGGLMILAFVVGLIAGFYFFSKNPISTEVTLKELQETNLVEEVTSFTMGEIVAINNGSFKIKIENKGEKSYMLVDDIDLSEVEVGDQVRVEFIFDAQREEFIATKIEEI